MPQQYLRQCSLVVGDPTQGIGLDLSEMHIKFQVRRGDTSTPNSVDIRVYNLSDDTANLILTGNKGQDSNTANGATPEFTQLTLSAGYPDGIGLIFRGTILQVRKGQENQTDRYIDIRAADGDEAYNFSVMNVSLAAGSTAADHVSAIAQAMGVQTGYMPSLSTSRLPRGKVFFGMARDPMRDLVKTQDAQWSIQDGKLQIVSLTNFIPGEVVTINSASGMIGWPEQTTNGIHIRTLLNPNIKIGTVVQINNASIQDYLFQAASTGLTDRLATPSVDADGYYQVYIAEHTGDTRGQEWYSDLICLSVDSNARFPKGLTSKTGVANPTPVKRNP